jgi:disulfide bond formation protein DsbB
MKKILQKFYDQKNFLFLVLTFLLASSSLALCLAYISQYIFNYQPCILCLYQRIPFFIIVFLSAIGLAIYRKIKIAKIIFLFCLAMLFFNAIIAFYHSGVEYKIFKGFSGCNAQDLSSVKNIEELRKIIEKTNSVKCDEPQLFVLGLSMAEWNFIFCLGLFIFLNLLNFIFTKRSKIK